MRKRGLASPDIADALALTFARPMFPRQFDSWTNGANNVVSDYSPIEEFEREQEGRPRVPQRVYRAGVSATATGVRMSKPTGMME